MTETITVYHAAEAFDSEGSVQKWRLFLREDVADAFAAKHAFLSGRGTVEQRDLRVVHIGGMTYVLGEQVHETLADADEQKRVEVRRRAVAKLTAEERAALGVA